MTAMKKTTTKKVAAKPAAAKKTAVKTAAVKKAPAKPKAKAPAKKKAPAASQPQVTPEQRYCMIQEAAYFIAERHGFQGDSAYFWSLAEAEIDAKLK